MEQRFAARYEELESWHWWFQGRQRILETLLARELGRGRGGARRLAALGCGPAAGLSWLTPLAGPGGVVVGVDADPSGALREARAEKPADLPERVGFAYGRIESLPLAPRSCDAVLALDVIEHLEDDAGALAHAHALTRPGGFVLVTVPALPSLWGNQDSVSHHKRRYTRASLRRAFERAGVPPTRVSYFNTLLFPPIAAVRWGRRALGLTDGDQSDFDQSKPGALNTLLTGLFASERHWLTRAGLPVGVSLLALVRVR